MYPIELPDITGLSPFDAAIRYAHYGIPVVPFDPTKGKGKSCGNLVGGSQLWYKQVTTNKAQLYAWRNQFGDFQALATSPGEFGCVVIDVDNPPATPQHWRSLLAKAPYVNTRPQESPNRGHYWFSLPKGLTLGNPTFEWGELRCVGGGIVLPPYGDRCVVRSGDLPLLPDELSNLLATHGGNAGAERVDLAWFFETYTEEKYPHKLKGLAALHARVSANLSPHDAMRYVLNVGFGEAVIGYVSARAVYDALLQLWDHGRGQYEFKNLAASCAGYVLAENVDALKLRSDRATGTDSRSYVFPK